MNRADQGKRDPLSRQTWEPDHAAIGIATRSRSLLASVCSECKYYMAQQGAAWTTGKITGQFTGIKAIIIRYQA